MPKLIVNSTKIMSKVIRENSSKKYDSSILGELGKGAGKGGGAGGPIREAGGPFGKQGAAREEEYYHKKQRELIQKLKEKLIEENKVREQEIEEHEKSIQNNKEQVEKIEEVEDELNNRK